MSIFLIKSILALIFFAAALISYLVMPAFPSLSDHDIADLLAFLKTF
jgi:hypothetical protein